MVSRREFLKLTGASAGALMAMRYDLRRAFATYVANNTLDPSTITQYAAPLVIPPAMPSNQKGKNKDFDYYEIAVRQFGQQILPTVDGFGPTTVWSYGNVSYPATFNYPAFTIEASYGKEVRVNWINDLVDKRGKFLPHLLPVDPTLHWANPIGARDMRPLPTDTNYWANAYLNGENGSYTGPVPIVTHVHGAHVYQESDGYPEAWYLPAAKNLRGVTWNVGSFYDQYAAEFKAKTGQGWDPGTAVFQYPNDMRDTTLWYHDHTLGMTRLNVYAGPAGFWLIRGNPSDDVTGLPGPAPTVGSDPFSTGFYEIPIVIQDRSFDQNGQLWYPYYRAFFEGLGDVPDFLQIPFTPNLALNGSPSDVAPIWQPEFFGNVMVVNGISWPFLNVEQQQYRFRLLNGCNSRFLILDFSGITNVKVWQIGADGGFLPNSAVNITSSQDNKILMGPAERADVIVDFRSVAPGNYTLGNLGPDEPFGGDPVVGSGDMPEMREVMRFIVSSGSSLPNNAFTEPDALILPSVVPLTEDNERHVSLNEEMSLVVYVPFDADADEFVLDTNGTLWEVPFGATPTEITTGPNTGKWEYTGLPGVLWDTDWSAAEFGPTAALLGDITGGTNTRRLWMDAVTENPTKDTTEEWAIHNFTVDAHPIHIHLVQFQVVGRYDPDDNLISGPEPGETGFKDTVIAYPEQVTKVKAKFDIPGRFVWHCHIVEHEDNEMMRPYDVVG